MAISGGDGSIILDTKVDTKGLNSGLTSMKGAITKIGGLLAAAFSVKMLINFAKENKNLYKIQMQNEVKLATIMRQRMKATDDEIKSVLELASAQQQIGIIGDEVQLAGLQQVATFATQKETIETLLPAMNNLIAQQYGYEASTESARNVANLMGKVLQGQVGALTRVGITFSAAEEQMLKTGNEMERAAVLAQVITNNVGEMNSALAQTDVGRQQQLANTWGDIKEQFGAAFQQIAIIALPVLNAVAKALAWVANIARMVAQTIANMFGMKTSGGGGGGQSTGIGGMATSTEEAAEGMSNLGNATEKAGKQAKKSTASFDDLEILTESAASSAGSAAEEMENAASGIGRDIGTGFDFGIQADIDTAPLENALKRIGEIAKTVWDSTPVKTYVELIKSQFGFILEFSYETTKSLVLNVFETFNEVEENILNSINNMIKFWVMLWKDLSTTYNKWKPKLIESVNSLFSTIWDTAFEPYIILMATSWEDVSESLVNIWDKYGAELLDSVFEFVDTTTNHFKTLYNNIIEPIITPFLKDMSWLWKKYISGMIEDVGEFVSELVLFVTAINNKFIVPIINYISQKLSPAWSSITTLVSGVFGSVVAIISSSVSSITTILKGIIQFISGVFARDWKKAWEGIKNIFSGIWTSLKSLVKSPLNLIIDSLNSFIAGINKIKWDLPNWDILGSWAGKTFAINIPKIPKLAQGTVVPPNREFLAVLGDNTREHEIVSPISTMKQAFAEAMLDIGATGQVTKEEHYYLNETELMSIMYKLVKGGERLKGNSLISGGVL